MADYVAGGDPEELRRAAGMVISSTILLDPEHAEAMLTGCGHVVDDDDTGRAVRHWFALMDEKSQRVRPRAENRVTGFAMQPWFNVRKAAQVAAYFALKQGGPINVLKLTKQAAADAAPRRRPDRVVQEASNAG